MSWFKFIRAVFRGEHKLSPLSWVTLVAAIIYAVWPVDLIPDLLGPIGLIDDAGVWAIMIALLAREKSRYEVTQGPIDVKATRIS